MRREINARWDTKVHMSLISNKCVTSVPQSSVCCLLIRLCGGGRMWLERQCVGNAFMFVQLPAIMSKFKAIIKNMAIWIKSSCPVNVIVNYYVVFRKSNQHHCFVFTVCHNMMRKLWPRLWSFEDGTILHVGAGHQILRNSISDTLYCEFICHQKETKCICEYTCIDCWIFGIRQSNISEWML